MKGCWTSQAASAQTLPIQTGAKTLQIRGCPLQMQSFSRNAAHNKNFAVAKFFLCICKVSLKPPFRGKTLQLQSFCCSMSRVFVWTEKLCSCKVFSLQLQSFFFARGGAQTLLKPPLTKTPFPRSWTRGPKTAVSETLVLRLRPKNSCFRNECFRTQVLKPQFLKPLF